MVLNVHYREYQTTVERLGTCLDALSSAEDVVWPHETWAPMVLSDGLNVGSSGGHGPVRYYVEAHEPLRMVRFRFTGPSGFDGTHAFSVEPAAGGRARLTHVIDMKLHGAARLAWPLIFRPLHDALLEDALECVAQTLDASARHWPKHSAQVRCLRKVSVFLLRIKKRQEARRKVDQPIGKT